MIFIIILLVVVLIAIYFLYKHGDIKIGGFDFAPDYRSAISDDPIITYEEVEDEPEPQPQPQPKKNAGLSQLDTTHSDWLKHLQSNKVKDNELQKHTMVNTMARSFNRESDKSWSDARLFPDLINKD